MGQLFFYREPDNFCVMSDDTIRKESQLEKSVNSKYFSIQRKVILMTSFFQLLFADCNRISIDPISTVAFNWISC